MAMKGYSIFPKVPGLEPCYQIQFGVISRTHVGGGGLASQLGCSRCILQSQATGLLTIVEYKHGTRNSTVAVHSNKSPSLYLMISAQIHPILLLIFLVKILFLNMNN